jgi:hypothetical protein
MSVPEVLNDVLISMITAFAKFYTNHSITIKSKYKYSDITEKIIGCCFGANHKPATVFRR